MTTQRERIAPMADEIEAMVERLRMLVRELDATPTLLAEQTGTSRQAIANILNGKTRKPHGHTLKVLVDALEDNLADREPGEERFLPESAAVPEIELFDIPGVGHAVFRNTAPEQVEEYLRAIFRAQQP